MDGITTEYEHMHEENEPNTDHEETLQHLTQLLPSVLSTLEDAGQIDTYIKFNELLAYGKFPVETFAICCF